MFKLENQNLVRVFLLHNAASRMTNNFEITGVSVVSNINPSLKKKSRQHYQPFGIIVLCILVHGGTSKKGHNKGHKWPFSVCVNLKKDPNRHHRP